MAILKNRLAAQYSQLPNALITDNRLSHGAFRVAAYLFTKPNNWQVNNKDIQKSLTIKQAHTLAGYWKELLSTGWLARQKIISADGKFAGGYDYSLNVEVPQCGTSLNWVKPTSGKNHIHSNTDSLNNTDSSNNNEYGAKAPQRFKKPDIIDVTAYFEEKNSNSVEAEKFWFFYDSKNWFVGKNKMKNWRSAASGWLARNKKQSNGKQLIKSHKINYG